MSNLDDILGDLEKDGTISADYSDSLSDSDDLPAKKKYSSSSESEESDDESEDGAFNVDDLDDLIGELEQQDQNGVIRTRGPRVKGLKEYGARKTTKRQEIRGVFDGDALDRILDEIDEAARDNVKGNTDKLGFGVINAERKFDLRAPKAVAVNANVELTLFIFTQTGEKSRIPMKLFKVNLRAPYKIPFELIDNKDGSYNIKFQPTKVGEIFVEVDGYGKRQFDWEIRVMAVAVAKNCTAEAILPMKVKEQCTVVITARDSDNKQLEIGGCDFNLSFHGVGQLTEVGLMDKGDGTYNLVFAPDTLGDYAIFITLGGEEIKTYPVTFTAVPRQ